ncbi:hypothetical protein J3A83DRAFT_4099689 [Scleroderma citrinum]
MTNLSNGNVSGSERSRVNVNDRALVDKVLARYPGEFTVFRELLQNADDAKANSVEIHFQTRKHVDFPEKAPSESVNDLNTVRLFRWTVRNNGSRFTPEDWKRLTSIADGNPDEQKIGAFGVGFFSVFSITDRPVIISGGWLSYLRSGHFEISRPGNRKTMFYDKDKDCEDSEWTVFEMNLKPGVQTAIPKPLDLSRFLSAAVTFLVSVIKVTILFNGIPLSKISKSRENPVKLQLPVDLKASSPTESLIVKSVKTTVQRVEVVISDLAYCAGSKKHLPRKKAKSPYVDPTMKGRFFGNKAKPDNVHAPAVIDRPLERTFTVRYTVYSAEVTSTPSCEMTGGIESATTKKPPKKFLFEAVHLAMNEYENMTQDDNDKICSVGSVFRGSQGLLSDQDGEYGARLFVGQSTAQTTGIAVHLSSRFIPTIERGLIDLANGQVQKWNEELLYIGGFMARLIYEQAMGSVRNSWLAGAEQAREEGLSLMKSFTFRPSTPDPKVADLLRNAFFECSKSPSFPVVSNLGIRDSKDVRFPNPTFALFMKQRPVIDNSLLPEHATMIVHLPKRYKVTTYIFRDVMEELAQRTLTEHEMIACVAWWVELFRKGTAEAKYNREFIRCAKFQPALQGSNRDVKLVDIRKFVNAKGSGSYILAGDPLPPDTIPIAFTAQLDPNAIRASLGWEEMTILDWVRYLTSPGLHHEHDIRVSTRFVNRVLGVLQSSWQSLEVVEKFQIIELMQGIEFIPTNRGPMKPKDAYFQEVDLFDDLPVVQDLDIDEQVLEALGVRNDISWNDIKPRLSHSKCCPYRLATYLGRVSRNMSDHELSELRQAPIFSSESGEYYCITDLHTPDLFHIELGLPIVRWRDSGGSNHQEALSRLVGLGLREYPRLDVIIMKAACSEISVRRFALKFLINNIDNLYLDYDPADFADIPFIPCGKATQENMGTPEQVLTSSEWELLGFQKIHPTVTGTAAMQLKIKDRPSSSAIINALRKTRPKNSKEARNWFELLAHKSFTAEEQKELSDLKIVPIHTINSTRKSATDPVEWVQARQCFFDLPNEANAHHLKLFNFVRLGPSAHMFLGMCGAKPKPDCTDIAEALLRDADRYLGIADSQKYLNDLRQVAVGFTSLPEEIKTRLQNAKIFPGYQRKCEQNSTAQMSEMALKRATEILIADDMESLRLFGDRVFVAPKEEVFDLFYKAMGAGVLSVHVVHAVTQGDVISKDGEALRTHILERVKIFLYDQDSGRRSDVDPAEWYHYPERFTVKYCKELHIMKSLTFEHASKGGASQREMALAGAEMTTERNIVLWVKDGPSEDKHDCMSVALCRLLFKTHKAHDTSSLMTILDANLDDLKRRGYDGNSVSCIVNLSNLFTLQLTLSFGVDEVSCFKS